jgi:hypothetical protein
MPTVLRSPICKWSTETGLKKNPDILTLERAGEIKKLDFKTGVPVECQCASVIFQLANLFKTKIVVSTDSASKMPVLETAVNQNKPEDKTRCLRKRLLPQGIFEKEA